MSAERVTAASAQLGEEKVPDFFIVGHHKSGTTAMYEMLRRHPQIYMPEMKEPEFFGRDRSRAEASSSAGNRRSPTYAQSRPQTLAEYLALFEAAAPGQLTGEASPSYLRSPTAARLIAEVQPAARIIAILREPASFLRSLHLQMVRNHVESESDFGKAIAKDARASEHAGELQYTDRVRYVEQLRRYHDAFSREQVLVLIYDDFRADNDATVRSVLRFLDVDAAAPIAAVDANPTLAARSRQLDHWVRALRAGRGPLARTLNTALKALVPKRMRRDAVRALQRNVVLGAPPAPDERLMVELRRRFKPEVVALSEYLDRDLVSLWGYDSIS